MLQESTSPQENHSQSEAQYRYCSMTMLLITQNWALNKVKLDILAEFSVKLSGL